MTPARWPSIQRDTVVKVALISTASLGLTVIWTAIIALSEAINHGDVGILSGVIFCFGVFFIVYGMCNTFRWLLYSRNGSPNGSLLAVCHLLISLSGATMIIAAMGLAISSWPQ